MDFLSEQKQSESDPPSMQEPSQETKIQSQYQPQIEPINPINPINPLTLFNVDQLSYIQSIQSTYEQKTQKLIQEFMSTIIINHTNIEKMFQTETESIKKCILTTVGVENKGKPVDCTTFNNKIKHYPILKQVLFIMKFVISTKDGVLTCWPIKLQDEDQYVFVVNVYLLKFIAKHLFTRDIALRDIDNVISFFVEAGIETYLFTNDQNIEPARKVFPVEPIVRDKDGDKKQKWFGFRPEILSDLFKMLGLADNIHLQKSKFTEKITNEATLQKHTGKNDNNLFSDLNKFLKEGSRSHVYPTKSKQPIKGKIHWGVSVGSEFFTDAIYYAIMQLRDPKQPKPSSSFEKVHIGPGWIMLKNEPILDSSYPIFRQPLPKEKETYKIKKTQSSKSKKSKQKESQSSQSSQSSQEKHSKKVQLEGSKNPSKKNKKSQLEQKKKKQKTLDKTEGIKHKESVESVESVNISTTSQANSPLSPNSLPLLPHNSKVFISPRGFSCSQMNPGEISECDTPKS
jgi:hypothetical protein